MNELIAEYKAFARTARRLPDGAIWPDIANDWEKYRALCVAIAREGLNTGWSYKRIAGVLSFKPAYVYTLARYGGKTPSFATRRDVKSRDGNKCRRCPTRRNLQVHHVGDPSNHSMDNLETLCIPCHAAEHRARREKAALANLEKARATKKENTKQV